jgi:hypothetical protein
MHTQTTSRILLSATFFASVMIGTSVTAQVAPHVPLGNSPQQTQQNRGAQNHAGVERNQSCQRIISECRNLGFIQGEWKQDNGLWKDCFDPVVHGGQATRDGKPISVPVSSSDIQACRGAAGQRNQNANKPPIR